MKPEDIGFIKDAIAIITAGITNRVDSKDKSISVYRVKKYHKGGYQKCTA